MTAASDPDPDKARMALLRCDQLQHQRAVVGQHLGFALCANPVLDMVLALYCAFARGYDLSLSSLGATANVPPTTALRSIRLMEAHGLVKRMADFSDGRRTHVRLTGTSITMLQDMFEAMEVPPRPRPAD